MYSLHLSADRGAVISQEQSPKYPAADEVCLEVMATGLCRSDLAIIKGELCSKKALPMEHRIPGHEFSGRVLIAGADTPLQKGQAVCVHPFIGCSRCEHCQQKHPEHCEQTHMLGLDTDGCFAAYLTLPARACFVPPVSLNTPSSQKHWAILAYAEPVAAALGAFNALGGPQIKAGLQGAIVGQNRIATLTQMILQYHGIAAEILSPEAFLQRPPYQYDYLIESGLSAVHCPDLLHKMLMALKTGGQCILKSRHVSRLSVPVAEMVRRDLRLRGAYYGDFASAVALLEHLDFKELLGDYYVFKDYAHFLTPHDAEQRKPFLFPVAV